MKVLVLGAGGVGAPAAALLSSRGFAQVVVADLDPTRARLAAERAGDAVEHAAVDAGDTAAVAELLASSGATAVLNACDPRFVMPVFQAAGRTGVTYLDMAMSLSSPHPERPHEQTGVLLGELQFAQHDAWVERGQLALCGMGVEPGLSDVLARYAADHLFSEIDEVAVRDGGVRDGRSGALGREAGPGGVEVGDDDPGEAARGEQCGRRCADAACAQHEHRHRGRHRRSCRRSGAGAIGAPAVIPRPSGFR